MLSRTLASIRPRGVRSSGDWVGRQVCFLTNRTDMPTGATGAQGGPSIRAGCARVLPGKSARSPDLVGLELLDLDQLTRRLNQSGRGVVLNVHGVATTFAESVNDTAKLDGNLQMGKLGLAPLLFSWPSRGAAIGYLSDANAAERSQTALARILAFLIAEFRGAHVIAHSHGAKLLLRAAQERRATNGDSEGGLGTALLIAPDVDARLMEDLLPHLMSLFRRAALYYCDRDVALALVARGYAGRRAGVVGVRHWPPDLDCINVSQVVRSVVAHSYHTSCRPVLSDMYYALKGVPAGDRHGLSSGGERGLFFMRDAA